MVRALFFVCSLLGADVIDLYGGVGFEITKHYKCFSGTLPNKTLEDPQLREGSFTTEVLTMLLNQNWYSWENHALTITKGNYRYFEILGK